MKEGGVALLSPCGWGNLGDAAIQEAAIHNIRLRRPHARIIAFTLNPADTTERHGIPAYPLVARPLPGHWVALPTVSPDKNAENSGGGGTLNQLGARIQTSIRTHLKRIGFLASTVRGLRRSYASVSVELRHLVKVVRIARHVDTIVVSGGGQIGEDGGTPWAMPFRLFKWSVVSRIVRARFVVLSVGATPVQSRLSRTFLKLALARAKYRSYRDEDSVKVVRDLRVSGKHELVPDLAFSLDYSSGALEARTKNSQPAVALGLIDHANRYGWPDKSKEAYVRYLDALGGFARHLVDSGYRINLLTTSPAEQRVDNDLRAILGSYEDAVGPPHPPTLAGAMAVLQSVDAVIASRLHGVLLSLVAGKPVLTISYHDKVRRLGIDAGLGKYVIPVPQLSLTRLKDAFEALWSARVVLEARVQAHLVRSRTLLRQQYDEVFGRGETPA